MRCNYFSDWMSYLPRVWTGNRKKKYGQVIYYLILLGCNNALIRVIILTSIFELNYSYNHEV